MDFGRILPAKLEPSWAKMGPSWAKLALSWASWSKDGPSWRQVGTKLDKMDEHGGQDEQDEPT